MRAIIVASLSQIIFCDRVCTWGRLDVPYAEAEKATRRACKVTKAPFQLLLNSSHQVLQLGNLSGPELPARAWDHPQGPEAGQCAAGP